MGADDDYGSISNRSGHWSDAAEDDQGNPPSKTLFVGDLPDNVKGTELRKVFEKFGTVTSTTPASSATTHRGYGFVTLTDVDSARKALFKCHKTHLFTRYMSNAIRFSTSDQHARMEQVSEVTKITAARSQWFGLIPKDQQPALGKAKDAGSSYHVPTEESSSPSNAPKAPRAMLAKIQETIHAPSSVSKDISPPPLRRSDSHIRSNRQASDCYRPGEHNDSGSTPSTYGGREIDRYVPGHRFQNAAYSPPRGGERQRPLSTQTSSPKLFRHLSWRAPDAPRDVVSQRQAESISTPLQSASKISDEGNIQESSTSQTRTKDVPVTNLLPRTEEVFAMTTERGNQAPAARDTSMPWESASDLPTIADKSLLTLEKRKQTLKLVKADGQSENASSSSSEYDNVLGPPKLTTQHLRVHNGRRVHNDETASIISHVTASSTKATTSSTRIRRIKQCMQCEKPEDSVVGKFTRCDRCTRRYHWQCGTPAPKSATDGIPFTCGSCLRKSKGAKMLLKQTRALRPHLGTSADEVSAVKVRTNIFETGSPADITSVSTPEGSSQQRQLVGDFDGASDPAFQLAHIHLTPLVALESATSLAKESNGSLPPPKELSPASTRETDLEAPVAKLATDANAKGSKEAAHPVQTQSAHPASPEVFHSPQISKVQPHGRPARVNEQDVIIPKDRSPVSQPAFLDRRRPSDVRPPASTFGEAQRRAAATAARYKTVTCPSWKSYGCERADEDCMFAHHSTVIDTPSRDRINRHWTCYFWRDPYLCPSGRSCPFAHEDTGLYLTEDRKVSTKHVTCTFWYKTHCNKTADLCKYAHQDTGIYLNRQRVGMLMRPPTKDSRENDHRSQPAETKPRDSRPSTAYPSRLADGSPKARIRTPNTSRSSFAGHIRARELHRPSASEHLAPSQAIDDTSDPGSPYSPMSAVAEDSKMLLGPGAEAPVSPALSTPTKTIDPVPGVDTPFSPVSSVSSPIRDVHPDPRRQIGALDSPTHDAVLRHASPSNTSQHIASNLSGTEYPFNEAAAAMSAAQAESQPLFDTGVSLLPRDPASHVSVDTLGSNAVEKEATSQATPVRHFAKRSTIDPRIRRRMAEAAKQEKHATHDEVPKVKIPTLKKCDKCEKRILGSSTLCTSCSSSDASMPHDNAGNLSETTVLSVMAHNEQDTEIEELAPFVAGFMDEIAAKSILTVGKKSPELANIADESNKIPKRPKEDSPFIARKRLKLDVPITIKRLPSQHMKFPPGLQYRDPKSTKALEELNRLDRDQSGRGIAAKLSEKNEVVSESTVEGAGNKENQHPSFSPVSQLGEGQDPDSFPIEGSNTDAANQPRIPEKADIPSTREAEKAPILHSNPIIPAEKRRNSDLAQTAELVLGPPKPRTMLKLNFMARKWSASKRCEECSVAHKRCLHDGQGNLDPALCYDFMQERRMFPERQKTRHTKISELAKIKQVARRYRADSTAEESSDESDLPELPKGLPSEAEDNEQATAVTSPASDDDLLRRFMGKPEPPASNPERNNGSAFRSSGSGRTVEQSPLASMPTPAHTPSPALPDPEQPQIQTQAPPASSKAKAAEAAISQEHSKLLAKLRKRGVQVDSDSDSDDEMEDTAPQQNLFGQDFGLKPKVSSQDLFDIAPVLRPTLQAIPTQDHATAPYTSRTGIPKKQLWKTLLQRQCAERRSKYGNPHQILINDFPSRTVRTTVEHELPLSAEDRANFVVPMRVDKRVDMPFERFMRMPEEPVVVREKVVKERGRVVEFELSYREGKRDRERGVSLAGRRIRDGGERWPFAKG